MNDIPDGSPDTDSFTPSSTSGAMNSPAARTPLQSAYASIDGSRPLIMSVVLFATRISNDAAPDSFDWFFAVSVAA